MFLALLPILFGSIWAESFLYLHPANPEYHPKDVFPTMKFAPHGKIRDLPSSGLIYLNRIKPLDPFVKAFGAQTVEKKSSVDLSPPSKIIQKEEEQQLTLISHNSIETEIVPEQKEPIFTNPKEITQNDVDALDDLIRELKSEPSDSKTGEVETKPPKLVTLRGTRVAGTVSTHRRPPARLVRLDRVGSTATIKNSPEFDPWERIGQ